MERRPACYDPPGGRVCGPPLASPIDLTAPTTTGGRVAVISRIVPVVRRGTSHGWEPLDDAGAVLLGTATAVLRSVIVRMPGEHRIDGTMPPAEVQLRFVADEGAEVVIAVPVTKGAFSPALDDLIHGVLDIRALLPQPRGFLAYQGTETIPPFQRPTMWLVSPTPLTARTRQLVGLLDQMPLPPRRIQPSQGRPVIHLDAKVLSLRDGAGDPRRTTSLP